jgi:hypothetical protein
VFFSSNKDLSVRTAEASGSSINLRKDGNNDHLRYYRVFPHVFSGELYLFPSKNPIIDL